MSNKKKTIKKITKTNAELRKTLASVRSQLTKTDTKLTNANNKAERWKAEAAANRTAATRSDARAERLQKKLDRATDALKPTPAAGPREVAVSGRKTAGPTTSDGLTVPDKSWTVVQLRAEARARGLPGLWDKTKAQLVADLST